MEKKTGVYICSGCEIGKSINIEKLSLTVTGEQNITVCKNHSSLCSVEGYELICQDIEKEKLDCVVIAACSPRVKTGIFDFPENIVCERVNLREQVAWCYEPGDEDTQMAAEDYLRMGIARVKNISIPQPYIADDISSDILVVGGGITGITASIGGAKAGYTIHLIEKEEKLGGWSGKLYKQIPDKEPYNKLIEPVVKEKIRDVEDNPGINVYKSATISKISGQPGKFEVVIQNGQEQKITVGSIVASMGWKPYDANALTHLGYGKYKNVITNVEFEEFIKENPQRQLPKSILFIQCAGSRDKDHLPYC
ncbi:MAG: CoB--CoM heterodisulfide reductase iron-sulfur subunit A family protein, partial [Bacteroidales bacterium]|nr:CoB--CoM heterodisulfide reductase iron-sulfur subunit A family protein [Bacteroidales bacterium]